MYINAIGYHCESEDNCLKSNIEQEIQFLEKTKSFCCNAINRSLPYLPYDIAAIDTIVLMSEVRLNEISFVLRQEYDLLNTKIIEISSNYTLVNTLELINIFFSLKLSHKALLIYMGEESVAYFFSDEKIRTKEGRLIRISHVLVEHKQSKSLYMSHIKSILEMNGYFLSDLSYIIFNDSRNKVIKSAIAALDIPKDKILENAGNSKNKDIEPFLTLAQNYEDFKANDLIYISFFKESFLLGACLLEIS